MTYSANSRPSSLPGRPNLVRPHWLPGGPSFRPARACGALVVMIGRVNADLELRLRLAVRAASGQRHEVKELIDTGFDDFLTMPPALIAALGLRWLCRQ